MSTEKTEFHLFTLKQEEEKKSTSPQAPKERYFSLSKDILKKEGKKKKTLKRNGELLLALESTTSEKWQPFKLHTGRALHFKLRMGN